MLAPGWRYGEHHLEDLVNAVAYTDADVVATVPARDNGACPVEHRFVRSVQPEAALGRRDLVVSRGWPVGVDGCKELESWFRQGVRFYMADAGGAGPEASGGRRARTVSAEPSAPQA